MHQVGTQASGRTVKERRTIGLKYSPKSEMPSLPVPLDRYGRRLLSQYDEDGIIDGIVRCIDPPREFVEFGCHPAECNCLALTSWRGLFMDGQDYGDPRIRRE